MASSQDEHTDCTTFDKLLAPLNSELEAIEAKRQVHHRETLSFTAFVRLLIYYFTSSVKSGRQLLADTLSAAPELELSLVKRATFFDAFQRFPVEWFVTLLGTLLASVTWKTIPEKVPPAAREEIKRRVQDVFYAPSLEIAKERAAEVLREYQDEHPAAMRSLNDDLQACLAYLRCPLAHHRSIRTTNLLERAFRESRRRTKVIPHFFTRSLIPYSSLLFK